MRPIETQAPRSSTAHTQRCGEMPSLPQQPAAAAIKPVLITGVGRSNVHLIERKRAAAPWGGAGAIDGRGKLEAACGSVPGWASAPWLWLGQGARGTRHRPGSWRRSLTVPSAASDLCLGGGCGACPARQRAHRYGLERGGAGRACCCLRRGCAGGAHGRTLVKSRALAEIRGRRPRWRLSASCLGK